MNKVVNVGIGGKSFTMEENAYSLLNDYLEKFRTRTKMGVQSKEVMDDLELRIAELFSARVNSFKDVVEKSTVKEVIIQLGMPDGEPYFFGSSFEGGADSQEWRESDNHSSSKKLFRNPDAKAIGGVCSGLAIYFNLDMVLIRVLFVVGLILGGAAFWIYVVLWIAAPLAVTPVQKCEMRGMPVTAENIRKFSGNKEYK
jgi:phage shock protein PspC (stress-responsive transcriptional regulator)